MFDDVSMSPMCAPQPPTVPSCGLIRSIRARDAGGIDPGPTRCASQNDMPGRSTGVSLVGDVAARMAGASIRMRESRRFGHSHK
jgi:hypothetical protein